MRNVSLRAEIRVGGMPTDFGSLSARSLVTGSDGRATLVYTAPPRPAASRRHVHVVDIVVTPVGTDFGNRHPRSRPSVSCRRASSSRRRTCARRSRSTRRDSADRPDRALRRVEQHVAGEQSDRDLYVGLRRRRDRQRAARRTRLRRRRHLRRHADDCRRARPHGVDVAERSPSRPGAPADGGRSSSRRPRRASNQAVNFNAVGSRLPAPGRRIVSYTWDFGDGTPRVTRPARRAHTLHAPPATYSVTLVVTDDLGPHRHDGRTTVHGRQSIAPGDERRRATQCLDMLTAHRRIETPGPTDPASIAFAALAEEYRRAGQFDEAIATCRAGLLRHPAYLSARVTLGRALIEIGRFDEARDELEHVLRVAPENLAAIRGARRDSSPPRRPARRSREATTLRLTRTRTRIPNRRRRSRLHERRPFRSLSRS